MHTWHLTYFDYSVDAKLTKGEGLSYRELSKDINTRKVHKRYESEMTLTGLVGNSGLDSSLKALPSLHEESKVPTAVNKVCNPLRLKNKPSAFRFKTKSNKFESKESLIQKFQHSRAGYLMYMKCMLIFKYGVLLVAYEAYKEFRVPQHGTNTNPDADFVILIDKSKIRKLDKVLGEIAENEGSAHLRTQSSMVEFSQKISSMGRNKALK